MKSRALLTGLLLLLPALANAADAGESLVHLANQLRQVSHGDRIIGHVGRHDIGGER